MPKLHGETKSIIIELLVEKIKSLKDNKEQLDQYVRVLDNVIEYINN